VEKLSIPRVKGAPMKKTFMAHATLWFVASALAAQAQTATWTIDPAHTQATFQVRHLSVSNVRGTISNVTGLVVWNPNDPRRCSVTAQLDVNSINTANDARDKVIKGADFFNVAQHPTMTFKSTSVQKAGSGYKVYGDLTLAGVTKQTVLDVDGPAPPQKGTRGGIVSGLSASTQIQRTDFNFGTKFPNGMLSNEIKITIDLEMGQK
jgi:polyisoprenoid-binding protein YceI